MISGYDSLHIRTTIPRLEEAVRYGESAGDRQVPGLPWCQLLMIDIFFRLYQSLASIHAILARLYVCEHRKLFAALVPSQYPEFVTVSDLLVSAEEVLIYSFADPCGPI
jgi:hypothetical protein